MQFFEFYSRNLNFSDFQLGRCTSPMHMHSHRRTGHLYNCKLMDRFSSFFKEDVFILYVDSSRFYSLLSWLASPQMCAYVLFGKRSTSNPKREAVESFQSLVTSRTDRLMPRLRVTPAWQTLLFEDWGAIFSSLVELIVLNSVWQALFF